jgi:hypothetical protein
MLTLSWKVDECEPLPPARRCIASGVEWNPPRLDTSMQGLTIVPVPAQFELTLPLSAQLKLTLSPIYPNLTRGCGPEVLKLSSDVSGVFPKVLKLSSDVSECKPLPRCRRLVPPRAMQRRGAAG